jgi:hypothetical protein
MLTSAQFRAKAIQYGALEQTAKSPSARREYHGLEEIFSALADNQQWLVENQRKTGGEIGSEVLAEVDLAVDEERMLRSLGVAVILQWSTLPAKLQRELFENASAVDDQWETTQDEGRLARFLYDPKNDKAAVG